MGDISMDSGKLADPRLLEVIDKLFEYNIGEHVALPQLLVVGDQSSGKSSVLEGLTKLPFPRDSGLCTRFATQITFRRAPTTSTTVTVIPSANASKEQDAKLRGWKKQGLQTLDRETFASILHEVQELMGVGRPSDSGNKTFSEDVLRIELCGPDQEHLSVVDVPGIFRRVTEGLTTQSDKSMVRAMVTSYMENPRSIILAVIPANVDIATQEILDMAQELDKTGQRTLGVLTKPDLVDKGAEGNVIGLLEGKAHKLNLGWAMVRNPGQDELKDASFNRHSAEVEFFGTKHPWTKLEKDKVGIESLQARLSEILASTVRREFPHVKADINKRLKECKERLHELGPSRDTKDKQHRYLLNLAAKFQTLTSHALKAYYGGDNVFDDNVSLKLATLVVSRNELFSRDMAFRGHALKFGKSAEEPDSDDEEVAANRGRKKGDGPRTDSEDESQAYYGVSILLATRKPSISIRYIPDVGEIEDLLHPGSRCIKPKSNSIVKWLKDTYLSSRGFELGTFDASVLTTMWKKQSVPWDSFALGYISDIICVIHGFIEELLQACCADERVLNGLKSILVDHLTQRYQKAIEHVKFLLSVERDGTPLTTNHYFSDNLDKARQLRMRGQMEKMAYNANPAPNFQPPQSATFQPQLSFGSGQAQSFPSTQYQSPAPSFDGRVVRIDSLLSNFNVSNADHTVSDLHDILKAYYKVARKRFVDNVCMQAADWNLVNGPDTPLKVFSPGFVTDLSAEQLRMIAGEDMWTLRKRQDLSRQIENLEKGRKVLI